MNLSSTTPLKTKPVDEDLAKQAHPGQGIPSQDPEPAAQFALKPEEAEREAKSVLVGGGVVAGAASGAAIGAAVAGPVGIVVGATVGTVIGALGAAAAGTMATPTDANIAEGGAGGANAGKPTAPVHKVIAASALKIWAVLTTPAALKQFFFGADVVTDWKIGSAIRMNGEFNGKPYEDKGNIVTFDAPRQLSFSHWSAMSGQADTPANYHLITFDLVPEGAATKVTLSQANLMGGVSASDIEHRADYEKNWTSVLDGLAKVSMA